MSGTDGRNLWLRVFHPSPEAVARMVCFPHAGGSAGYYGPMSQLLQPDIEVAAVQYPGRQDRRGEPCLEDIAALAEGVYGSLRAWDDKPLAFFGHSLGALVAYETARRVARHEGRPPEALFLSASANPGFPRSSRATVHGLDDDGLVAELRRVSGPDRDWLDHRKLVAEVLPVIRSDYTAAETYNWSPGLPLECAIIALVGDSDPYTNPEQVSGWRDFCCGGFRMEVLTGGHFYLQEHGADVAALIAERLVSPSAGPAPDPAYRAR